MSLLDKLLSMENSDVGMMNRLSAIFPPPSWLFWTIVAEMGVLIGGIVIAVVGAVVFIRRPLFHRNLLCIIANTYFLWWTMLIGRVGVCVMSFADPLILGLCFGGFVDFEFFEQIRIVGGGGAIGSMGMIIFERIAATKYLGTYETTRNPLPVAIGVVAVWLWGSLSSLLLYHSNFGTFCTLLGNFCIIVCVAVGFKWANSSNKRCWRQCRTMQRCFTLSQRFQINENRRVLDIINRCILTFVVTGSFLLFLVFYALCSERDLLSDQIFVIRSLTNISCGMVANILLIAALTGTHAWREELIRLTVRISDRKVIRFKEPLRNLNGIQLTFAATEEREIYFRQLNAAWK